MVRSTEQKKLLLNMMDCELFQKLNKLCGKFSPPPQKKRLK